VAIRDMVACGCPADFVAGLALPRSRVTGIEDPRRPEGIWPFAWRAASARITDELEIGLAINPEDARTQDQMHVHLLRLTPGARAWLDAAPIAPREDVTLLELTSLDRVFATVAERVGTATMGDHGILVARRKDGGWIAAITDETSPQAFTQNHCAPPRDGEETS
jgi:CDP-diacylglycerol pyrophosphatase